MPRRYDEDRSLSEEAKLLIVDGHSMKFTTNHAEKIGVGYTHVYQDGDT